MGIDVYLKYVGISKAEEDGQITGFKTEGEAGYLREAYHGGPYATKILVPETFDEEPFSTMGGGPGIPVPLPEGDGETVKVMLAEMGVKIIQVPNEYYGQYEDEPEFREYVHIPAKVLRQRLPAAIATAHQRGRTVYNDPGGDPEKARGLTDFVRLAEKWEAEGKLTYLYNSY